MAKVLMFTDQNWREEVASASMPVLVDFRVHQVENRAVQNWALEKFSEDFEKAVKVGFVDISQSLGLALRHRIQDLTCLCLFQKGKILKAFNGCERVMLMEAWWISRFAKDFRPSGFFRPDP
jgi:thioredoxin-like negative regulator of GroEL